MKDIAALKGISSHLSSSSHHSHALIRLYEPLPTPAEVHAYAQESESLQTLELGSHITQLCVCRTNAGFDVDAWPPRVLASLEDGFAGLNPFTWNTSDAATQLLQYREDHGSAAEQSKPDQLLHGPSGSRQANTLQSVESRCGRKPNASWTMIVLDPDARRIVRG
ncbi:hypothetical protein NM688_g7939 [Phlebia brevispora]|uniref:Uncharacterized protein n=1 Tax=Phlebia brevispora TaxID=194682 RepID=A0ACC1RZC4_9APHY|nr:hypothetical protein NM688_g7939 [Phlebia brevispora]